jgi:murein DD-endopeptidase MepM/ murein hydrolase activator NlpD
MDRLMKARFCGQAGATLLALTLCACAGSDGPDTGYAPAPSSYVTVPVANGDTVAGVSKRYHVEQDDVLAMNRLTDPKKRLAAGSLRVPSYRTAPTEQAAEETDPPHVPVHSHYTRAPLPPIQPSPKSASSQTASPVPLPKPRPNPPSPQPAQASPWLDMKWFSSFVADVPAPKPGVVTFVWPLQGQVLSSFGANNAGERNDGINIAAARGAPIHAAADGTVTYVGDEIKAYGNLILIRHDSGYVTAYAHADSVTVERGERVSRGQLIAHAGTTGDVDRPQLHFELRAGTKPVDPKPYLVASK